MSRYSPSILPDYGPALTEQLANAFTDALAMRRAAEDRRDAKAERKERLRFDKATAIDKGLRYGQAPEPGPGMRVTIPPPAQFPTFEQGFRRAVGAEPAAPQSPLAPGAFDAALKNELTHGGPGVASAMVDTTGAGAVPPTQGEIARGRPSVLGQPPQLGPVRHPGAFDPTTGQFGGSAGRTITLKDPSAGRYVPIDEQSYMDLEQTPMAESARNREAQIAMSANFRGQQATALEDQKQKGRLALSAQVARSNMIRDWHNSLYKEAGSAAHDTRTASARATADAAKPALQDKKWDAAADIVRATADETGKLDVYRAIDWLENTEEGRAMAAKGMTRSDLIVGFGRASGVDAKTGAALTQGVTGSRPSEAGGDVATVRASGRARPVDVTDEAKLSDADLWEYKVKNGMDKTAATAYVTNRKKKTKP